MTVEAIEVGAGLDLGRNALVGYFRARLAAGCADTALPDIELLGDGDVNRAPSPAPRRDGPGRMPIQLTSSSALIGPVPAPGATNQPCAQCLRLRWQRGRTVPERTALERGSPVTALSPSPYLTAFAMHAIWRLWTALGEGGGRRDSPADGIARGYEIHLETLRVTSFSLIVDSACPTCRPRRPDTPERARIELRSRRKRDVDSFHPRPLRDHELPIEALTNPVCGVIGNVTIVDMTSPTTSPSVGTFHVGHGTWNLFEVIWTGQTDSFETSGTAGLFEGLERYAGVEQRRITELLVDSYDNVSDHALDPRDCGLYPDEVYERSEELSPFDPGRPIPWVWGYSLRDERPILVPRRLAYYGPSIADDNFVHECSNGCASGTSIEEAVLHGLLELVERDAFLLAWYGRAVLPEIDPASCAAPARSMADRIRLSGYEVRLFDARIDLPIPVVVAVAARLDGGPGTLAFSAAASLDPQAAVLGALSEVASYVPTMQIRVEERPDELAAMSRDFSKVTRLADHPALYALPQMAVHAQAMLAPRPVAALDTLYAAWRAARPRALDLLADLRYCVDLLVDAGFDVITVEQTAPEQEVLGLRTAQVIVPGLIPIDFGWAKQRALWMARTRTAFRRAGWRLTDLTEADLHRVPHPFP
jgi:ribosomal protein S12 methylthiotransferase accessory factor